MRCKYCFYADETKKRGIKNYGVMSMVTLKNILTQVFSKAEMRCGIAFQGGEPTLVGLDFFEAVVEYSNKLNVNKCKVDYAIQTNGILLDEEWCAFFARHKFLVGVSLDGTRKIHDENRVDTTGGGTHSRVMKAICLLAKHKVDTNILTVVTSSVSRHFPQIHSYFRQNGLYYRQFIPCIDPLNEERGRHPWSLTPKLFECYLKSAFDCWYADVQNGTYQYHRYFDNLLMLLNDQLPEACGMIGVCGKQYIVEADGTVFPCDFYMTDHYKLGNLNTNTLEEIDAKRKEIHFIEQSMDLVKECLACRWKNLCRGGCRRDRDYFIEGIGRNWYCSAFKSFFDYAYNRLKIVYDMFVRKEMGR
jgi:uncharacterized protein